MSSPQNLPYQAYKSKRHSRTASNLYAPNVSPPPVSRPPSAVSNLSLNGGGGGPVAASAPTAGAERRGSIDTNQYQQQHQFHNSVDLDLEPRPNSVPPPTTNAHANRVNENGVPVNVMAAHRASLSLSMVGDTTGAGAAGLGEGTGKGKEGILVEVQAPAPIRGGGVGVAPPPSISPISEPPLTLNGTQKEEARNNYIKLNGNAVMDPPEPEPEPKFESGSRTQAEDNPVSGPSIATSTVSRSASTSVSGSVGISPAPPTSTQMTTTTATNPTPKTIPRKTSSFRHVPLRGSSFRSPLPSSPLRPATTLPHQPQPQHNRSASSVSTSTLGSGSRQSEQQLGPSQSHLIASQTQTRTQSRNRITSLVSVQSPIPTSSDMQRHPTSIPSSSSRDSVSISLYPEQPQLPEGTNTMVPPPRTHSLTNTPRPIAKHHGPSPFQSHTPSPAATPKTVPSPALTASLLPPPLTVSTSTPSQPTRPTAPYRPGFQPKGVYRPLTEEFISARRNHRDVGRVERTKLERRFEKLIALHFSEARDIDTNNDKVEKEKGNVRSGAADRRRTSSFFDLDLSDLRNMDAGELWKGVLQSQVVQGGKADIRAAEQRITPWQDDASVSNCPLCSASFHPLTNRKHHCRLCGQIICSLPVRRPQRAETCSLLFVVDPKTRRIEEVGEGVDYGVRKRQSLPPPGLGNGKGKRKGKEAEKEEPVLEEEKFLKGVRICRQCRPVLLRQQYHQEVVHVPTFSRLYDVFISLEKEIEDSLPQFQELILTLSHDDQPTKEASAARKRLLEAFAQYDALAKRIRKIPRPGGKGSSEDRVQLAILSRANLFLQKNMFPLQSLPKPKPPKSTKSASVDDGPVIDPDSAIAHALQPLLEQEALLESFVEEAKAHRKFQDAKTLKTNLYEIRAEIDKVMANADASISQPTGKANTGRK